MVELCMFFDNFMAGAIKWNALSRIWFFYVWVWIRAEFVGSGGEVRHYANAELLIRLGVDMSD